MGHNSPEGIFLGQELLLDFAALDLTSNADNRITVYQLPSKFQNTFWFLKTCWWLMPLSRLYDASQSPGRDTSYFKTMPKILVDGALMRHISFLFDGISFDARSIHVLCSRHKNWYKQSVPRFPLYILFSFDSKTTKILWNTVSTGCLFAVQQNNKVSFAFRSTKDLQKMLLGKLSFFAHVISQEQSAPQRKKLQRNVSQVKRSPHAKIQLFLSTFKLAKISRGHSCPQPFNCFQFTILYLPWLHSMLYVLPSTVNTLCS